MVIPAALRAERTTRSGSPRMEVVRLEPVHLANAGTDRSLAGRRRRLLVLRYHRVVPWRSWPPQRLEDAVRDVDGGGQVHVRQRVCCRGGARAVVGDDKYSP